MNEADESYDGAMKRAHRAEAKIRELEAELADLRTYRDLHYCGEKGIVERATSELKARAEKAEGMYRMADDALTACTMARKQAEARIAELETMLRRPTREERVDEGRPVIEAREREE